MILGDGAFGKSLGHEVGALLRDWRDQNCLFLPYKDIVRVNVWQKRNRLTDTENKCGFQRGEGRGAGTNSGYGIKRYKLLCMQQISNKDILYSTEDYNHYLIITYNGV